MADHRKYSSQNEWSGRTTTGESAIKMHPKSVAAISINRCLRIKTRRICRPSGARTHCLLRPMHRNRKQISARDNKVIKRKPAHARSNESFWKGLGGEIKRAKKSHKSKKNFRHLSSSLIVFMQTICRTNHLSSSSTRNLRQLSVRVPVLCMCKIDVYLCMVVVFVFCTVGVACRGTISRESFAHIYFLSYLVVYLTLNFVHTRVHIHQV